jgi:hypothetical protein
MSETPANDDSGRLLACRACGNRVARSARRCPACGAREPTRAAPAPVPSPPAPARRRWTAFASLAGAALFGAAVTAAVFVLRPIASPPPLEHRPAPPAPPPAPAAPVTVAPPPAPESSRSRGRADWLFFFKPGDQLVRMGDDTPLGMVIRTVPRNAFADGTVGPAYLVQTPDGGGQRVMDADELERGSRLQP